MPTFSDVTLQLPLDGSDGSTSFPDVSNSALTLGYTGSAQIDTDQSKWGGASLSIPGGSSLTFSTPDASFGFGTSPWTVEAWIRLTVLSGPRYIFDFRNALAAHSGAHYLYVTTDGRLALRSGSIFGDAGTAITLNTWHHAAWCFDGTTLRIFLDGVAQWSGAFTNNLGTIRPLTIGKQHNSLTGQFFGHVDDVRMTKGAWYTANFSAPTSANDSPVSALILESGLLQQPATFGAAGTFSFASESGVLRSPSSVMHVPTVGVAFAPSVLGLHSATAYHDFTGQIDAAAPTTYVMDLVTPGGLVRVPISSWQATLQTDVQSYVQCVVPAATDWVPDIEAATEFVVTRRGTLLDGSSIEYEMARAPAQTVSLDGGSFNYTATISGYAAALDAVEDPPAAFDRTLAGVRTVSRNSGNVRVRCNIDWLLRPGQRAYFNDEAIVVRFVNYYVPGFDQYMDVGDRST